MKKLLLITGFAFTFALFPDLCKGQYSYAGITFDSISSGMTSPGAYVLALAMKDSSFSSPLYAGGHFKIAGRDTAINIAEWIDTLNSFPGGQGPWIPLGKGTDSDVCALAMFHNYLYAGGKFDTAGGIPASHIARWDTSALKWDSLVGKLNGTVYALCVYNNNLYVGGDFTIADGDTLNRIAVWKDSVWAAVGSGFDTGAVYALTVCNDTLYAGGSFLKSNGIRVNHIAKLSGSNWDSLRSGTNNTVYALSPGIYFYELMVGGAFTKSGDTATRYISCFFTYNQTWTPVGLGVNDTVRALNNGWGGIASGIKKRTGQGIGGGNILLLGGNFDSAWGYSSRYIAGYSGFTGCDTIGGLNGPVYALANPYQAYYGQNYVGGKFSLTAYESLFNHTPVTLNNVGQIGIFLGGGIPSLSDNSDINVYPNPSSGVFKFQANSQQLMANSRIEVYNVLGEKVYSNLMPQTPKGALSVIDLNSQPNGIYLYRIVDANGDLIGEGKLIIQK